MFTSRAVVVHRSGTKVGTPSARLRRRGFSCADRNGGVHLPSSKRGVLLPCAGSLFNLPTCHLPRRGSTVAGFLMRCHASLRLIAPPNHLSLSGAYRHRRRLCRHVVWEVVPRESCPLPSLPRSDSEECHMPLPSL